jgi:hypothetical protein
MTQVLQQRNLEKIGLFRDNISVRSQLKSQYIVEMFVFNLTSMESILLDKQFYMVLYEMYSEKQIYLLAVTDKNYVDGRFLLKFFFSLLEEIKTVMKFFFIILKQFKFKPI